MHGWELDEGFASEHGEVRWTRRGDGPPLVFLHGTPFSSYVWRDIAAAFTATHTVYLWDMPGYGRSEMREGQDVSLAAQQGVFTELLGHWGLDSPAVVAHDFGGAVALRTTLLGGIPYGRLALFDPVSLRPWGSPFFTLAGENASVFERLPPKLHEALVRAYVGSAAFTPLREETLSALVAPWLGEAGQPAFYRQIAQADERYTAEMEHLYGTLTTPVLIGWGHDDTWIPRDRAERLAAAVPTARLELIGQAGHLVQEDAPARVTGLLKDFIR